MSAIDDGGPAFPVQEQRSGNGELIQHFGPGMSLRAYIAVHRRMPDDYAVDWAADLVGRPIPSIKDHPDKLEYSRVCRQWWMEAEAAYSVAQADALIAALKVVTP